MTESWDIRGSMFTLKIMDRDITNTQIQSCCAKQSSYVPKSFTPEPTVLISLRRFAASLRSLSPRLQFHPTTNNAWKIVNGRRLYPREFNGRQSSWLTIGGCVKVASSYELRICILLNGCRNRPPTKIQKRLLNITTRINANYSWCHAIPTHAE